MRQLNAALVPSRNRAALTPVPIFRSLYSMGITAIVIIVLVALIALYGVAIYNRLVSLRNRYQNAFAQIEVQLKRRYDLIPNLVETAKAYLAHERGTLEEV